MRTLMLISAVFIAIGSTAPAYADKFVFYDRHHHDRRDHHPRGKAHGYWSKHDRRHYTPYVERTIIRNHYYAPTPLYNSGATYSEIRCTNDYNPLGLLLGGAAGGIVGNQIGKGRGNIAATIGGAVLGSAIGNGISRQRCTEQVFQQAPIGTPIRWQTGNDYYAVTPMREYRTAGRYCREYQANATVAGRIQQTYGTACMQPDGSWEIIN